MSDDIDMAKEGIESAHHHAEHAPEGDPSGGWARQAALLIAFLAAALALSEMGSKNKQNEYLTHHITASDDWNFYQAKTIRANLYNQEADLLSSLPNAGDPATVKRVDDARAIAKRLEDDEKTQGRKQLMAKAQASEKLRDHAFHELHLYEYAVGALQIAIVLASVSVVTRQRVFVYVAALLGGVAGLFALLTSMGAIDVIQGMFAATPH
jgi:uncharacterized protein (UPF0297 family)